MTDDIKEAVVFMSEAMESLLKLCDEYIDDGEEAEALKEIRAAKEHYDGILRGAKVLRPIPEGEGEDLLEGGSRPMDLVSLAEQMSSAPNADAHQDGQ